MSSRMAISCLSKRVLLRVELVRTTDDDRYEFIEQIKTLDQKNVKRIKMSYNVH